jgi:glycosyltransferase involved in cell wall biosynthesis
MIITGQPGSRILEEAARAAIETRGVRMRGSWDGPAVLRLTRLIRDERIDLVHTHSSTDAWVAGLAARAARVPVVRSRHVSIPIRGRFNPVYRWLADRVVASGEAVARLVRDAGVRPDRVAVLPAGVDLSAFTPGQVPADVLREFGGRRPIIGSVAMFRGSKGHDRLLDAFARVRSDRMDARLLLVGDGIRRPWVEELVRERGLVGSVHFAGFRRNVADFLRLMDCFALASTRTEGVPQSLLQAMAVGVPVVASAIGGIPEAITDGETGLLVDPDNPGQLAARIGAVLDDPVAARRRATVARRMVETRFSRPRLEERLLALYRELL